MKIRRTDMFGEFSESRFRQSPTPEAQLLFWQKNLVFLFKDALCWLQHSSYR